MTGQMTRYNYQLEGKYVAAAAVQNGNLVTLNGSLKWAKVAALDATLMFTCTEKTELYGVEAYRFVVTGEPATAYGFVDCGKDVNASAAYEYATYTIPANALCSVHILQMGDEFVTNNCTSVEVGDTCTINASGVIVKKAG